MSNLYVLIISAHDMFANEVCNQLSSGEFAVRWISPGEAQKVVSFRDYKPDVLLIDYDVETKDGTPLYQAIKKILPKCQVILICEPQQTQEAAQLVRSLEVFDYVLFTAVEDKSRIPLIVERACMRCSSDNSSNTKGQTNLQVREILGILSELRMVLKYDGDSPIVKMIDMFKMSDIPQSARSEIFDFNMVNAYEHSLVEAICGRIKRLENAIVSSHGGDHVSDNACENLILIVEDDPICGEMAEFILQQHGYQVIKASTADEARTALIRHNPALVLMDVHLGKADGLRLVGSIRTGNVCQDVPVIVTTSDSLQNTVIEAVNVRVQGYLLKPYKPVLLIEKVQSVLEQSRQKAAAS